MPEEAVVETAPLSVVRNSITKVLKSFKIIRGDNKDKVYPAPEISAETLDEDIEWLGRDTVVSVLQTFVKRAAQELWLDNIDEATGQPNFPKFLAELADLTSASMKLSDLKDKYDELVAKQGMLVAEMPDDPTVEQFKAVKELSVAIQVVKAQMDNKSRKNKPEQNAEAAVVVQ